MVCLLSPACSLVIEDLPHILALCPALQPTRDKLQCFSRKYCEKYCQEISELVLNMCSQTSPQFCQFLLDCSPLPAVVSAVQLHGEELLSHLFQITRTWVYTLHKERMKMLGRWNPVWEPSVDQRRLYCNNWTHTVMQAQLRFEGPLQKLPIFCGCHQYSELVNLIVVIFRFNKERKENNSFFHIV